MSFLNMSIPDRGGGVGNRYKEWTRKCGEQILGVDQSIRLLLFLLYASTIERFEGRSLSSTIIYFHTERKSAHHFLYMKNMSFIFKFYLSPPPWKCHGGIGFFFSSFRLIYVFLLNSLNIARSTTLEESTLHVTGTPPRRLARYGFYGFGMFRIRSLTH